MAIWKDSTPAKNPAPTPAAPAESPKAASFEPTPIRDITSPAPAPKPSPSLISP